MNTEPDNLIGTLLASMAPDELADMASYGTRREVGHGEVILREGGILEELSVIETGHAEVTVTGPGGDQQIIATLGPGDAIGEMGLLAGSPASATVRASGAVVLLTYRREDIERILALHPSVERALGRVVIQRLSRTQRRLAGHQARLVHVIEGPATAGQVPALAASAAWHARRPVLALVPGGTDGPNDLIARFSGQTLAPCGIVMAVSSTVLEALPKLAADLAGQFAAVIALVPSSSAGGPVDVTFADLPSLVPAREEAAAVEAGLLAPASPYGLAMGRAGRAAIGRRVGVAFGSGSARGFAHAGVMDVLLENGVPVDAVSGTSIGAAAAALVALGRDGDAILEVLERAGQLVVKPWLSRSSLFSPRHLARYFQEQVGDQRLEALPIPIGLVASDLDSGEEVVFHRGLLRAAVMASIAIPGVYPPQHVGGRRLIDGAFVNPVPADVVGRLGAEVVIAVKLATRARERVDLVALPTSGKLPWAPQAILRSVDIMSNAVSRALPAHGAIVIEPTFAGAGGSLTDFRKGGARFRAEGRRAAEAALPALRAQLPWLTPVR